MSQDIFADIKQSLGRLANKISRGVAQKALADMQHAHKAIVDNYYSGYTPVKYYSYISPKTHLRVYTHGYKRTYNFRDNSLISLGISPSGKNGFKASVSIGPEKMNNYVNSMGRVFPSSSVFNLIWEKANRGLPPNYIGHVGFFDIGVGFSHISMGLGSPNQAMWDFMNQWWDAVGSNEADAIWISSSL